MCANYISEIEQFIGEHCLIGPEYYIPAKDLMQEINRKRGINLNATRSFPNAMNGYMGRNASVVKKKVGGTVYYQGITLKVNSNSGSNSDPPVVQHQPEDIIMIKCLQCESSQYDYIKKNNLIVKVYYAGTNQLDEFMTLQSTRQKVDEHVKFIIGNMKTLIKRINTTASEYLRARDQDIISSIILVDPDYIPQYNENNILVIPVPQSQLQFIFDRRLNMKETCKETLRTIKRFNTYDESIRHLIAPNSLFNIPKLDDNILSVVKEGAKIETHINTQYTKEIKLEKETEMMLKNIALQASKGF